MSRLRSATGVSLFLVGFRTTSFKRKLIRPSLFTIYFLRNRKTQYREKVLKPILYKLTQWNTFLARRNIEAGSNKRVFSDVHEKNSPRKTLHRFLIKLKALLYELE